MESTASGLLARLGQQGGESSSAESSPSCSFTEMWRSSSPEMMKCSPFGGEDIFQSASNWHLREPSETDTADCFDYSSSTFSAASSSYSACAPSSPASNDDDLVNDELNGICSTMQGSKLQSFNAKILRKGRNGRVVNLPGRTRMVLSGSRQSSGAAFFKNNGARGRGGVVKPTARRHSEERASWIM